MLFGKRWTAKCDSRTVAPASAVCAAFAAQPRRVPTGSKKTGRCANVRERCGNGKRRRRRASSLPTNNFQNQYNSKCSWIQAADLMPLSVWTVAIFCHRKNFQNRLFKTRFSVGLNRRTFWGSLWRVRSKYFVNFCEKGPKKCVLAAYHMGGLFRETKKCKWSVNFHKRVSKNRVPVAYAVKGFFRGHTAQNAKICRIK